MKKFYLFATCMMVVFFAGCEGNDPASTNSLIVTGKAIDVSFNSATVYGEINGEITDYNSIEWGVMYSSDKAEVESRSGEKVFGTDDLLENVYSVSLSKLVAETKYYYCAFVYLNGKQYKFGKVKSFTTLETKSYFTPKAFSVSANKQVTFSPGNLQYTQSTDTWSFASAQYEVLGTDNVTGGSVVSDLEEGDSKEGDALADKIDLFGWSTSASNFGINEEGYRGRSFVDWGTNQIGNDVPNTWRTLSKDEWKYLLYNRPKASTLQGVASINKGVSGLILLPDDWTCPAGLTFESGFYDNYDHEWSIEDYATYQNFTADEWAQLEKAGAVLLVAAGKRSDFDVEYVRSDGFYWSTTDCTMYEGVAAWYIRFSAPGTGWDNGSRASGLSVRLVKDL